MWHISWLVYFSCFLLLLLCHVFTHGPCSSMGKQTDFFSSFFFFSSSFFFFSISFFPLPTFCFCLVQKTPWGGVGPWQSMLSCLHWFQTSITQSFFKLEHFLWPFLKTRNHDGSVHACRSSHIFLEVHQNMALKYLLTFLTKLGV